MHHAKYIEEPTIFIRHTEQRSFIGPGMIRLTDGSNLMAAPWGRPPTNFEQLAAAYPVPMLYRSRDGGRTWQEQGRMRMDWTLSGMISDGGITFLYLQDGCLAFLSHRHVEGLHGGGVPVFATSPDEGESWSPARMLIAEDSVQYVMNDRLIQLQNGRLIVPTSHPDGAYECEGDAVVARCFISDDSGQTWRFSSDAGVARLPGDKRGLQEPCVAEVPGGRLFMLARTGSGRKYASWSEDGGDTWSQPQPTTLTSACSSLTLKTLPDGRLIVFYNHAEPLNEGAFFPRTPLCYSVSADNGQTWAAPVIVDDSAMAACDRQNIYPSICFTDEGMLVVYSVHEADPKGSFAGQYSHLSPDCGGKRTILEYPAT